MSIDQKDEDEMAVRPVARVLRRQRRYAGTARERAPKPKRTIALGSGTTFILPDTTVDPFERPNGSKVTGINGGGPECGVTSTPPGIDDSEILKPVGEGSIEATEDVSNLKAGPGVNTRPLMLLELKLPAVAASAEVNVALTKTPLRISPKASLI